MKASSDKSLLLFLIPRVILPLMVIALTLALALPGRVTRTDSAVCAVPAGSVFHADVTLRAGTIHLSVADETGAVLLDETFDQSYSYAVTAYRAGEYAITADYVDAAGRVDIYLTDETGAHRGRPEGAAMKNLIFVNGTMGAGKTTVCRALQKRLEPCVLLDGDWCWDMRPFSVTDETKAVVTDNICAVLGNFLRCSAWESIIFCWVMQDKAIADSLLSRLDLTDVRVRLFTLMVSEDTLRARLGADVSAGKRTADVIERSIARLPLYARMDSEKIDTDALTPDEIAEIIARRMKGSENA